MLGVPSETQASPLERYPGRPGKAKLDCTRTRDSCDFSYCSEPSELGEPVEEYEDEATLFDMVCESSVTDEDSDFEPHLHRVPGGPRKRPPAGLPAAAQAQPADEGSGEVLLKKIKQELPEDYYIVANAELTAGADGPALALTQMSKPKAPVQAGPSGLGPTRALPLPAGPDPDPQHLCASPPGPPRLPVQRPPRAALVSPARGASSGPPAALQAPATSSNAAAVGKAISIPLSALQLPGQEEAPAAEETLLPAPQPAPGGGEAAVSPSVSAEPEVSSSQQQPPAAPAATPEAAVPSMPGRNLSGSGILGSPSVRGRWGMKPDVLPY